MKKGISIIIILIVFQNAKPQLPDEQMKFSGGMMCHTGYIQNNRSIQKLSGICYGIGGQMTFSYRSNVRAGLEGYASNFKYRGQEGYYKLGWGGLLLGYQVSDKRLHPVVSLTLGGGKIRDLFFVEGSTSDDEIDRVIYRKYPVMLISPSISAEYSLKSKLTLVMKLDYVLPIFSLHRSDYANGPRLYLGILFNRG